MLKPSPNRVLNSSAIDSCMMSGGIKIVYEVVMTPAYIKTRYRLPCRTRPALDLKGTRPALTLTETRPALILKGTRPALILKGQLLFMKDKDFFKNLKSFFSSDLYDFVQYKLCSLHIDENDEKF
ncbi:hypothetical protein KUTeg_000376 [Tegillarca granosa]|uniref:Uncharacterized protein n=1 Tax=Tegillarca granosa TaxID=220873 RepID=A0ABQ9FXD9_TEGGR|nr:hypothetical protein KUTeg_000376 [Tegillarca granosa]